MTALSSPFRNTEIRASAGTGKTYSLSVRFLRLIMEGADVDTILATTFTRKAAGEISGRLFELLAHAILDPAKHEQLTNQMGPSLTAERCEQLLAQLATHIHRLRVGTLDSFFARIARSYCLELSLAPDWTVINKVLSAALADQSVSDVMASFLAAPAQHLQDLLPQATAQRRLAVMVEESVKALRAIHKVTGEDCWPGLPEENRFDKAQLEALLEDIQRVDLPQHKKIHQNRLDNITAATEGDWTTILKKGIVPKLVEAGDGQVVFHGKEIPPQASVLFRQLAFHATAELLVPIRRKTKATHKLLTEYSQSYDALLRHHGVLDFDDVTQSLLPREGGTSLPVASSFRLDASIDHLLLDEFQDTSLLQWDVLRPLACHVAADAAQRRSLFCVGDTKQAIYGWRGGQSSIFEALRDQIDADLHKSDLTKSYRSSRPVIDAVNHVFTHLLDHPNLGDQRGAVCAWADGFPQHDTARDLAGGVEFIAAPCPDSTAAGIHSGTLHRMAALVSEISRDAPTCSIGVLARKNTYVHAAIHALREAGLEVSGEGGVTLDDTSPNQAILSLLTLVDHPGNSTALYHVTHSPLGQTTGLNTAHTAEQIDGILASLRRDLQNDGYGPTLEDLSRQLAPSCSVRQRYRLRQLVDLAFEFQPAQPSRTQEFLSHVQMERVEDPNSSRIRVMTINSAKGLEFDAVVLPQLHVDTVRRGTGDYAVGRDSPMGAIRRVMGYCPKHMQPFLPQTVQDMFAESLETRVHDSLSLLYVAFTRAIHGLHVILPAASWQKSYPKTLAGMVQAAIGAPAGLSEDTDLPSFGATDWYRNHEPESASEKHGKCGTADVRAVRLEPGLGLAPPNPSQRPEPISPSSLEGSRVVNQRSLLETGRSLAMERGSLVHDWMQQITWLDEGRPTRENLLRDIRASGQDESVADTFEACLTAEAIQRILDPSHYASLREDECCQALRDALKETGYSTQVHNELPVSAVEDGRHLHGIIDRLVLFRREENLIGADIIDYKTDRLDEDSEDFSLEARKAHYSGQLEAYGRAVASSLRIPLAHINLRLAFLFSGEVSRVAIDL